MSVVIETTIGDMTVDLFTEERPVACLNFMKLCKLKYYNYNLFHTVEQGFIAQTGDPTGAGDGGSSVWGVVEGTSKRFFEAESVPKIKHTSPGLLSLVSVGKNLVGSQCFFTLGSDLTSLDGTHCVIGEVVEGQETLRRLNEAIVDEKFRPFQDIRITHTVILEDPFPDPRGFRVPSRSPSPTAERMQNGRIGADEDIDDTGGKTVEEIQEILAEREAKARATILEIVGDLPDADMAPPENVLFVCKLNPVTTDDDLEIIFSRFGKVKNCEVIRDKKSGDSLQYAFVEFEEQNSCEAAYFKMDNVLIDDRRIHVDFSQSVAKVKWRGKGRGVEGQEGKIDFNNLKEVFNKGGRDQRPRYETVDRRDGREQITMEERRRAREERHREQERGDRKDRKARSRSKDRERRGDERRTDRSRREAVDERRNTQKSSDWECKGRDDSSERRRFNRRDDSRDRKRERDMTRLQERRPIDERRRYETSSLSSRRYREEHKASNSYSEKRNDNGVTKKLKRKKELKKRKVKKRRKSSSSDSSSESDSSSSTSESSSDSSTTDSSSSEDKRKIKKSKKSNKKQKANSSKTSKNKKKRNK